LIQLSAAGGVERPTVGDALERVLASILEDDSGAGYEVSH
jgi:hypothetical protein